MSLSWCWFLVLVGVWWLPLMLVVAEEQQGGGCSAKMCGNVIIFHPFWLTDIEMGRSCGSASYQDFDVACLNRSHPTLRSSVLFNIGFEILSISYDQRSLYAVDLDKLDLCRARNSCHVPIWNTSVKLNGPFRIDPGNLNLILYNCTAAAAASARWDRGLVQTSVRCANEWEVLVRAGVPHDATGDYAGYALEGCAATVAPVSGSSAGPGINGSGYEQLLNDGFRLTWSSPPQPTLLPRSKTTRTRIITIALISAAAALLFPCIYVLIWYMTGKRNWFLLWKKKSSSAEKQYEAMIASYGSLAPKRYTYSEVMKMTSSRHKQLGQGGYGVVFEGKVPDGHLVAVKFLHDCKGNGEEFVNEVMSIGRTSHVNVVSLFGFCLEGSKRALIYEYMCNGSLDRYIYSDNPKEILGWERLYAIAIGIARGLEYLHHSCNTHIIHFDIKPQNILLDKDFCPKIADFGLAKLCRNKESKLSMIGARGTIGFIAPEVHSRNFGLVSTKSDVYSYGMMLLEMVGGRKNVKSMAEKSSEKY